MHARRQFSIVGQLRQHNPNDNRWIADRQFNSTEALVRAAHERMTLGRLWGVMHGSELLPVFRTDVCLVQNTAESSNRDFMLPGDYRGVRSLATDAGELDVTTLLTYLSKTGSFKATLDFAEG